MFHFNCYDTSSNDGEIVFKMNEKFVFYKRKSEKIFGFFCWFCLYEEKKTKKEEKESEFVIYDEKKQGIVLSNEIVKLLNEEEEETKMKISVYSL